MDDKDVIIAAQEVRIQQLGKQVIDLQKLVEELRGEIARLKKDSSNSSKPPSSDIVKPPKPRTKGKRIKYIRIDLQSFLREQGEDHSLY